MGRPEEDLLVKFNKFYVIDKKTNCWNWIGSGQRYGKMTIKKKSISAHRISYELFNGIILTNKFVCHKCDNSKCVNPNHLFLGTQKDNVQDSVKKQRHKNNKKIYCLNNHEFNRINTYFRKDKIGRECRLCKKIRRKKYDK